MAFWLFSLWFANGWLICAFRGVVTNHQPVMGFLNDGVVNPLAGNHALLDSLGDSLGENHMMSTMVEETLELSSRWWIFPLLPEGDRKSVV